MQGHTIVGTYEYIAPEIFEHTSRSGVIPEQELEYDNKVDVWSLGVLLHFLCYGKVLFDNVAQYPKLIKSGVINFEYQPTFNGELSKIMQQCLKINPKERPTFEDILSNSFFQTVFPSNRKSIYPYKLCRKIGNGTDGATMVFECIKGAGDEKYAVKFINLLTKNNKEDKKRIDAEREILNQLKGIPHTIQVIDQFEVNSILYIIMDLANGGDLDSYYTKRLKAKKPITPEEQEKILAYILTPLSIMHSKHLIHRDIHPKNILIKTDPNDFNVISDVVLSDFGFAKLLLNDGGKMTRLGTAMPPELLGANAGEKCTEKVDMWGIGILLFYILYGMYPEKFPGTKKIFENPNKAEYPKPRNKISPFCETAMKLCLAKEGSARPEAAKLLAVDALAKYK